MARYVLKNRGEGLSMGEAQEVVHGFEDIVVERQGKNELLVSGPAQSVVRLTQELGGWFSAAVRSVQRPQIGALRHPKVRRLP
jgi:hypothetical protein